MQFGDRQIRNGREKSQDFLTYDEKSLWTLLSNMFNVSVMKDIFVWMEDGDRANLTVKCDTFLKKVFSLLGEFESGTQIVWWVEVVTKDVAGELLSVNDSSTQERPCEKSMIKLLNKTPNFSALNIIILLTVYALSSEYGNAYSLWHTYSYQ